jgi:hypothetical protein
MGATVAGTGQPINFSITPTNQQSYFRIKVVP